jgi:lysine-N-methylase
VPPARKSIALRYMAEFQCLGGECEDTCCTGWRVDVDESHYKKLKRLLERDPADEALFRRAFERNESPNRARHDFARLKLLDDQKCLYLDGAGLCTLHERFGERVLPDICATYPRTVSLAQHRMELTGALSCPEVVRRALLDERALDLVPVPPGLMGRGLVTQEVGPEIAHAYPAHLDDVRGTLYQLLDDGAYPIASRLFFAVYFAGRTREFFHADAPYADGDRLRREMAAFDDPRLREALHEQFRASRPSSEPVAVVILKVLASRMRGRTAVAFRRLLAEVLDSYARASGGVIDADGQRHDVTLSPERVWQIYCERRAARLPLFGERLDLYFTNYAKNFVMREWYVYVPNLVAYLQMLLLRVAMLRFLLFSHPRLDEVAAEADEARQREALDRILVEVVYTFSRSLDHNDDFLTAMTQLLDESFGTLEHSLCLLKF